MRSLGARVFRGRRRRIHMLLGSVVLTASLAAFVVPALAVISPSTFEGSDGNLVVNNTDPACAPHCTDWASFVNSSGVPNGTGAPGSPMLHAGIDLPSGTGDNSFGQGTKEDNAAVTTVTGSIPPNKSDLTRFYEASDLVNGNQVYLYLAWERSNVLGSANMDFEINQNNTGCPFGVGATGSAVTGTCTIPRTNGDMLVTYDFTNGGSRPTVGVLRWLAVGGSDPYSGAANSASSCYSSSSLPCWGDQKTISQSFSEGAVNTGAVSDPIAPSAANPCPSGGCPAGTFGEAAINLTGAGILNSQNACSFGSATTFLKSRSSASFTAEVKDYIAPISTPLVSLCGTVKIIKHTDPRGQNQAFNYTSNLPGASSFTLNDKGNTTSDSTANTMTVSTVPQGQYTVTEGTEPSGFSLENLSCTSTGGGASGAQDTTNRAQADITVAPDQTVTCTYTNQAQGEIKIIKHTDQRGIDQAFNFTSNVAGAGAFSLNDKGNTSSDNSANTEDVTNVAPGTYNVNETEPNGWTLESLSCSSSANGSSGGQDGTTSTQADITLAAGGLITCTYTNKAPAGAILVSKVSSKAAATPLHGATFQVCTNPGPYSMASPCTAPSGVTNPVGPSDSTGHVCVGGLFWNGSGVTYYVQEVGAPAGYSIDDANAEAVTVNQNASCSSTATAATFTFTDTPLTDLTVHVASEAAGGTKSNISCTDAAANNVGNSPQPGAGQFADPATATANGLKPGTYTCTVVVDP